MGVKYYSQQICKRGGHVHVLAALFLEGHPVVLIFSGSKDRQTTNGQTECRCTKCQLVVSPTAVKQVGLL
jgi:hypothetical protein